MRKKEKGKFYGWVIVAAGFAALFFGVGMYSLTSGAFVVPICTELGFSRTVYSLSRTCISVGSLLTASLYAKALVRLGSRKIMLLGLGAYTLTFLLFSFSSRAWQFFLLGLLQGAFSQCINFSTVGFLINLWFEDDRGLASGIAYAGSGVGGSILLTAARWIVEEHGWRVCYRAIALTGAACLLPLILFVVKDRPEHMRQMPFRRDGAGEKPAEKTGLSLAEAKKTGEYWALTVGLAMMYITTSQYTANYLAHLQNEGYPYALAASVLSVGMIVNTAAKVTLGLSYDRIGVARANYFVGAMFIFFGVAACLAGNRFFGWAGGVSYNLCAIGVTVSLSYVITRYFGNSDYPAVYASVTAPGQMISIVMPTLSGILFDLTGSYRTGWLICVFSGIVAAACMVIAERSHSRRGKGTG